MTGERVNQVDHGLGEMSMLDAYESRRVVTARASELGLIRAANEQVFHARGFALTRDTETGELWLTPTADPEGWTYAPDDQYHGGPIDPKEPE